jgi:hypothetical protein
MLLGLFGSEDGGGIFSRNVGLLYRKLHGVISERIVLFKR